MRHQMDWFVATAEWLTMKYFTWYTARMIFYMHLMMFDALSERTSVFVWALQTNRTGWMVHNVECVIIIGLVHSFQRADVFTAKSWLRCAPNMWCTRRLWQYIYLTGRKQRMVILHRGRCVCDGSVIMGCFSNVQQERNPFKANPVSDEGLWNTNN